MGTANLASPGRQSQDEYLKRYRFPTDIISYTVWLYYRFNLSHRDIEDLLAQRGITVSRRAGQCYKRGVSRVIAVLPYLNPSEDDR